jgi:squalene-hopene/tetraprenyl-beta-curcumene cyclase
LAGIRWLCGLQNRDGGWPTFCRGWGRLPFDRSGADLTAHAIRALDAWNDLVDSRRAIQRGLAYLSRAQQVDGSWIPLWFGNQDHPGEENPVYGTAKVLLAYRDLKLLDGLPARRGLNWLVASQNADGGWGGGAAVRQRTGGQWMSTVEETALAVEAVWGAACGGAPALGPVLTQGLEWLVDAVESGRWTQASPIGFYFAKLWYHERLYPIIFVVSALGQVLRHELTSYNPRSYSRRISSSDKPQPRRPVLPA